MAEEPTAPAAAGPADPEPPARRNAAALPPELGATDPAACNNCKRPLATGPFCQYCGQNQDDFHRSLPRLVGEVVGGLFDWDGRFLRTIPRLFLRPAELTRTYLAGERVSQTPPLKMFLVAVVMVFLAGEVANESRFITINNQITPASAVERPAPRDRIAAADPGNLDSPFARWFVPGMQRALQSPDAFAASLLAWAQRLAILLLPISAVTMGLMFAWRRGVLMYDHLIWTMHHLAAGGALLTAILLLTRVWSPAGWLIWLWPVHTFVHMKGTYRLGTVGTLWRMLGLVVIAGLGSLVLALALVVLTVYEVGGNARGATP